VTLQIKLRHPNGTTEVVEVRLNLPLPGIVGQDACAKANIIKQLLTSKQAMSVVNGQKVPIFMNVTVQAPIHFPGQANVEKEVCFVANPALRAAGIEVEIEAFCIGVANWTSSIVPLAWPVDPNAPLDPNEPPPPPGPFYRFYAIQIVAPPSEPGSFRVGFGNADPNNPQVTTYETSFSAGENPAAILRRIGLQIQGDGGNVELEGGVLRIARVGVEPPPHIDGLFNGAGPYLYEAGSLQHAPTLIGGELYTRRLLLSGINNGIPAVDERGVVLIVAALGIATVLMSRRGGR
jgi:hypothetical protein